MKEFLEELVGGLGKKLGETVDTATEKAGEMVEISRLKSQIRSMERDNIRDLVAIGRLIVCEFEQGVSHDEEMDGLCEAVLSRQESIAEYEEQLVCRKGGGLCPICRKPVYAQMNYCPYCGSEISEEAKTDMEAEADDLYEDVTEDEFREAAENITAPENDPDERK